MTTSFTVSSTDRDGEAFALSSAIAGRPWPNHAASVNALAAPRFQVGRPRRRVTELRRSAGETRCRAGVFSESGLSCPLRSFVAIGFFATKEHKGHKGGVSARRRGWVGHSRAVGPEPARDRLTSDILMAEPGCSSERAGCPLIASGRPRRVTEQRRWAIPGMSVGRSVLVHDMGTSVTDSQRCRDGEAFAWRPDIAERACPNHARQPMPVGPSDCIRTPSARHGCAMR